MLHNPLQSVCHLGPHFVAQYNFSSCISIFLFLFLFYVLSLYKPLAISVHSINFGIGIGIALLNDIRYNVTAKGCPFGYHYGVSYEKRNQPVILLKSRGRQDRFAGK